MQVSIGIHTYEQPEQLHATLESVRRNSDSSAQLILLPDGPDRPMSQALRNLVHLPQFGTEEPLGPAACFNRLAALTRGDIVVFLESGSRVGPGWLEHLLRALDSDPRNGLAGPTTNYAWNEQCVYRGSGNSQDEIARTAEAAALRFRNGVRTLAPLYSLADFCYAVRREVIEDLGVADETYGLGPCWEMDYNIRAARAGWRGVWACAAYVHRAPFTSRRQREEALRFEASKHRYQDKFCGARLRGEKKDYRTHCRGDSCPNFAPHDLVCIKHPSASAMAHAGKVVDSGSTTSSEGQAMPPVETPAQALDNQNSPNHSAAAPTVHVHQKSDPLVTCIMPTYNRRSYIPQAVRCFLRQDYPNCELLIVDDGTDQISDCIPDDPRIRYVRLDRKLSVGAKRNLACTQATGELIVHWDDDDWYPPRRVSFQVRALLEQSADMCGSSRVLYYRGATDQAWEYRYGASGAPWIAGNTLAYRRDVWERNKFPDIQVGEDSHFVWGGAGKAIIADLADSTLCVASVHSGNTSPKDTAGAYWYPQPSNRVYELLRDEIYLYRSATLPPQGNSCPLVSCIMPTYNRRSFVGLSLRNFNHQDYPRKELVIVDDGEDPVGDLVQDLPDVRYVRLSRRASIGTKRNLALQQAQGEMIAHWDDDDWYAPDRLRYQLAPILAGKADITGLENVFVLQLPGGSFWTTDSQLHQRMFVGNVHGGTLVYRRGLANGGVQYPEISLAEDAWFLQLAMRNGERLLRLSNPGIFVYVRHGRNAWRECIPGSFLDPAGWRRIDTPPMTSRAIWGLYKAAAANIGLPGACCESVHGTLVQ